MKNLFLKLAAAFALALAFPACSSSDDDNGVSGVTLDRTSLSLAVNAEYTLTATVLPDSAADKTVTWKSEPAGQDFIRVEPIPGTQQAKVTALRLGDATVVVTTTENSKTDRCSVAVVVPATGVTVSPASTSVAIGGTVNLTAAVQPANATIKTIKEWKSLSPEIATVEGNGVNAVVTGKAAGPARIVATSTEGEKTGFCDVTVTNPAPVSSVSVSPKTVPSLAVGDSVTLTVTVNPNNAGNKAVEWSTSAASTASISATTGNSITVTGVAPGPATITVKSVADSTKADTCSVTVAQGADVYVGGHGMMAKNGVQMGGVYENNNIIGIYMDSSDVLYAVGCDPSGSAVLPTYFRNGVRTNLPRTGSGTAVAQNIAVDGSTVHVVGIEYVGTPPQARYWRNGTLQTLPMPPGTVSRSDATGVCVRGSNVYICGTITTTGSTSYAGPCIWDISQNSCQTFAEYQGFDPSEGYEVPFNAIATDGTRLYVASWGVFRGTTPANISHAQADLDSYCNDVFVRGTNVYACGWYDTNGYPAFYAVNDVPTFLSVPGDWPEGHCIYVTAEGDIYVSGVTYAPDAQALSEFTPLVWKNGVRRDSSIPTGQKGFAYSVFAK